VLLKLFRVIAIAESLSFLVLFGALIVRLTLGGPSIAGALGPVHGMLFVSYLALILMLREGQGWSLPLTALLILAAMIPLGGWYAERRWAHAPRRPRPATPGGA
jgi:integral membrane protein